MTDPSLHRILDANANRAREGLRTAEDFVRFIVGSAAHAENLRALRQGVTKILSGIPGLSASLVAGRDVPGDPLQPENWKDLLRRVERETPREVALRGLKRSQEALRVLEEFLRGEALGPAEELGRLRYRAYEAEQWLCCCAESLQILRAARVMVLLSAEFCRNGDVLATARQVLRGGVRVLQFREKTQPDAQLLETAVQLQALCAEHHALLLCNDRVDLALACGAGGVHLGQDDLPLAAARKVAGSRLLFGKSTHGPEEARHAVEQEGVSYVGLGALFPTATKDRIQLGGLEIARRVYELKLDVPIFAIGGLTLARLPALRETGLRAVAVTQAITSAADPERAAREFVEALQD